MAALAGVFSRAVALLLLLLLAAAVPAAARSTFRGRIPNGLRVPCPPGVDGCTNGLCEGVGHNTCVGGSYPLNAFGQAFADASYDWPAVCPLDSDGDGQTNGEELGDPCCRWTPGVVSDALNSLEVSHPGFASSTSVSAASRDSCLEFAAPEVREDAAFNEGETKRVLDFNFTEPYELTTASTQYVHTYFDIPLEDKYHVVGFEAIVDNGDVLHHFLLYGCKKPMEPSFVHGKVMRSAGSMQQYCGDLLWGWAPGSDLHFMPREAGFLCGKLTDCQSLYLEVHYDNPQRLSGLVDRSSIKVMATPDLRANNMGILWLGSVTSHISVPPGRGNHYTSQLCSIRANRDVPYSYTATEYAVHAHQIGKTVWSERFKVDENQEMTFLSDFGRDDNFRFDNQMQRPLHAGAKFNKSDLFATTCIFDNSKGTTRVRGGQGSWDEMCINFISYYPMEPSLTCHEVDAKQGEFPDGAPLHAHTIWLPGESRPPSVEVQPGDDGDGADGDDGSDSGDREEAYLRAGAAAVCFEDVLRGPLAQLLDGHELEGQYGVSSSATCAVWRDATEFEAYEECDATTRSYIRGYARCLCDGFSHDHCASNAIPTTHDELMDVLEERASETSERGAPETSGGAAAALLAPALAAAAALAR